MILEIEYYKNDAFLSGKTVNASELKKQLDKTEQFAELTAGQLLKPMKSLISFMTAT